MNIKISPLAHTSLFNNPNSISESNSMTEHDQSSIMDDTLSSQFPLVSSTDSLDSSHEGFDQSMSWSDFEAQGSSSSILGDDCNITDEHHQGGGTISLQSRVQSQMHADSGRQSDSLPDTQSSGFDTQSYNPNNFWNDFSWESVTVDNTTSIAYAQDDQSTEFRNPSITFPEVATSDMASTHTHYHGVRNEDEPLRNIDSEDIPYRAANVCREGIQAVETEDVPEEKGAVSNNDNEEGAIADISDDDGLFVVPEPHKHDLRPGFRVSGPIFTTWHDRDASGNYDPHFKIPKKAARKRQSTGNTESAEVRRLTRTQRRLSEAAFRVNGNSHVVSLKFSSEKGKALLAAGTNNWPEDEWNILANPLQTAPISTASDENDDDDDILDPSLYRKGYRLRARRAAVIGISTNRPNLEGQPLARGCWGCYETGLSGNEDILNKEHGCSLALDSTDWPCSHCAEDGQECELIIPPKVKKSCERCNKRKVSCSYTRTPDHSDPCLECRELGGHCVAGPNRSMIYHRISLDNPTAPHERDVSCTECLNSNNKCTLNTELQNKTGRSCCNCEKEGHSCVIADQETPSYPLASEVERRKAAALQKRRRPAETILEDDHESRAAPAKRIKLHCSPCPPSTTRRPIPMTKIITTKLCHPIEFDCQSGCHFCKVPSYRVLGLGPETPTVIDEPRAMFTELRNGHNARRQENTKICSTCTFDLAKILMCGRHDLLPIPSHTVTGGTDFEAAFNRLTSGNLAEEDHWCQLCPAMAEYICGKKSEVLGYEGGCGLKLCWLCSSDLKLKYNYEVDRFMGDVPNEESPDRPFGLRADAELLKPDGQLGRFLERLAD